MKHKTIFSLKQIVKCIQNYFKMVTICKLHNKPQHTMIYIMDTLYIPKRWLYTVNSYSKTHIYKLALPLSLLISCYCIINTETILPQYTWSFHSEMSNVETRIYILKAWYQTYTLCSVFFFFYYIYSVNFWYPGWFWRD